MVRLAGKKASLLSREICFGVGRRKGPVKVTVDEIRPAALSRFKAPLPRSPKQRSDNLYFALLRHGMTSSCHDVLPALAAKGV